MTEPQLAPTPEQRAAIEDRERDLFLSAGSGVRPVTADDALGAL